MSFNIFNTPIKDLIVIEPEVTTGKGSFSMDTYSESKFAELGMNMHFVQDNHSKSSKGVLRGLHFQRTYPQGKLVRVIRGAVLDVVVDLRPESPTFGDHFAIELNAEDKLEFYVPERFAHGFITLRDDTEFLYKCTNYYYPEDEGGILWNDPDLNIDWGFEKFSIDANQLNISPKDIKLPLLKQLDKDNIWL